MKILVLLFLFLSAASGEDWPQFLGPARNGVYAATDVALPWPKGGPAVLWKKEIGQGFSGPVVSGGKVILFHRVGDREVVECLNARTGERIWMSDYATHYRDDFGFDEGPRGTPAIAAGRVYTFGAEGVLQSLDFETGKRIWSVETQPKFGVRKGFFGAACSPLVEGDRVLLNVGGPNGAGIAAFEAASGKTLWTATNDDAGYSAPIAATIGGVRHAIFFTRNGLVDVDPANGKIRFQFPWRSRGQASVNAAAPLLIGDLLFLSASYGTGAGVFQLDAVNAKRLWTSDDVLSNHYATSVYQDGYLYGYHGRQEFGPSLRAVELKTGKVAWSEDDFKAGTITLAGGQLLVLRESGELVLAPASPKAFQPVARAQVLPATVRSYPALADGRLYVRNEKTLVCLDLKKK
jgi:outer membrane protein assembly factor BamB